MIHDHHQTAYRSHLILCHSSSLSSSLLKLHYQASMMSGRTSGGSGGTVVGVRSCLMHMEKFLAMATCDLAMSFEDALSQWKQYAKTVEHDQLGPPQSPLRLNIPLEDFTFTEKKLIKNIFEKMEAEDSDSSSDAPDPKAKAMAKAWAPDPKAEAMAKSMRLWKPQLQGDGVGTDIEIRPEDAHTGRKLTSEVMQVSISTYDVDETQTPPEKQMKCARCNGPC